MPDGTMMNCNNLQAGTTSSHRPQPRLLLLLMCTYFIVFFLFYICSYMIVTVAPAHVTISGPTEARVGDTVPLTCVTASSNPPADIKWLIGGRSVRNATQRTVIAPEGGWITTSNTTAVVGPDKRALVVICHGLNMQLTENVVSTHTINVLCKFHAI